jgi:hypothetical protein
MITFTTFGDWAGAVIGLNALPSMIRSSGSYGQRKAAEKLVKIVKGHLNNQDLGWVKLNSKTESGDPRILVDTELYYRSIKAWKQGQNYYAGVPSTARYPKGNRVSHVATIHEFGYGVPERPLWRPSIEEMGGAEGIRRIIGTVIFNKVALLRSKGFTVVSGL